MSSKQVAKRALVAVLVGVMTTPALISGSAGAAPSPLPSVGLHAASTEETLYRYGRRVPVYLGMWLEAIGGDFELRVARADYDSPLQITQTDSSTGEVLRTLPVDVLDGWNGLAGFLTITFHDSTGAEAASTVATLCPNGYSRQRIGDAGPAVPRYPYSCGAGSPFTRGMIWGIDNHWAVNATAGEYEGASVRIPAGEYTVTVEIAPRYIEIFQIAPDRASATLNVTVKNVRRRHHRGSIPVGERRPSQSGTDQAVPTTLTPDPANLPDLVAHPPWSISAEHRPRSGKDLLTFAATEWNEGPRQLVLEGFRRRGEGVMDAYQYFYDGNGKAVGRAPIGTFEYHEGRGHDHWHFLQFTRYTLLSADGAEIVDSKKQSFCIVPTTVVDLTVPGADWLTEPQSLQTSCGGRESIWIREILQVGWGDTYYQVGGQSFDITDLPNGWYQMAVEVNPLGAIYEADTTNNVETRMLNLRGRPGNRKVIVTPWHGIDA